MHKLKILITGSKGFIGSHLTEALKQHEVIEWDISAGRDIFDFTFEAAVCKADIVIHLAAITSVDESFKHPDRVFMTNVLGTARVAYCCAKYKKKLIYPSSAAIYHRELSPYAESKALAEDIVRGIQAITPTVILRLQNVYGDNMNPSSGSIMYRFLTDHELVVFGDGEQTRDFVNVLDVCSIMRDAIKPRWDGKIVDVGTGQAWSTNYIAGLFGYHLKKDIRYQKPRREIKWSVANTKMLTTLYPLNLITNVERDIARLCKK